MASRELIIDDEFCSNMGEYFVRQGEAFEELIRMYQSELSTIREKAIISGDVADALTTYTSYVSRLTNRFKLISVSTRTQVSNFLSAVDEADKYLF